VAAERFKRLLPAGMDTGVLVPDWEVPPEVRAAVTLRSLGGVSQPPFDACNLGARCGDDADAVASNRDALGRLLDLPSRPRWLRQVHGTQVVEFAGPPPPASDVPVWGSQGRADEDSESEADAAFTRAEGTVLAILTADCLPILLCAADGSAIAAVHAGWRGLAAGVVEAAVGRFGADGADLRAWLGPGIGPMSYEVGEEVRSAFVDRDGQAAQAFVPTRPGHWLCDLYALARRRLRGVGVDRVSGGGFDTCSDARFYSYRREARTGRFATLIWRSATARG
jgi:YfiH family protein